MELVLDVVHESSQGCRHSAGVGTAATTSTSVAMLGGSGSASAWAFSREDVLHRLSRGSWLLR